MDKEYIFENECMAIMPGKFNNIIANRQTVIQVDNIAEVMAANATKFNNIKGKVVVLPVNGYISQQETYYSAIGVETSSITLGKWFDSVMNNNDIGAVVLNINSPGGTVSGLSSITEKIRSYKGAKPIIAVSNGLMASAAYYIGSAADEIVADPDSLTGSIGTVMTHLEASKYYENMGVKVTFIHAGKDKVIGNPYEPLSDESKNEFQKIVDYYYDSFVSTVAANRNTTASDIVKNYGQGKVLTAKDAKSVGMVDRIATLDGVIEQLIRRSKVTNSLKAQTELIKIK